MWRGYQTRELMKLKKVKKKSFTIIKPWKRVWKICRNKIFIIMSYVNLRKRAMIIRCMNRKTNDITEIFSS